MGRLAFGITCRSSVVVSFWGVRGSFPTAGSSTVRYGGHTSCVTVRADGHPPLVFDMGTGARGLGKLLLEQGEKEVFVLLSHTHMDHLYALPFFAPVFDAGCRVHIGVPAASAEDAFERISNYLNGVFHPLRMDDLAGVQFHGLPAGASFDVGPYSVQTLRLVHPGGVLGFRASFGGRSVCYVTDTGPLAPLGEGIMAGDEPTSMEADFLELIGGADLLVMDATFEAEEYASKVSWGHSYPEYAVEVARLAGVHKVALFHHSPDATDDMLDAVSAKWSSFTEPEVIVAKEGLSVSLEG